MNDLKSVASGKVWKNPTMAKQLKDNENTGKVVKAATTVGKEVVKAGAKGAAMAGKEVAKDKVDEAKKKVTDKVDKVMGTKRGEGVNKKARDFIMGGTKEERYAKKVAKKEAKRMAKEAKKAEKEEE